MKKIFLYRNKRSFRYINDKGIKQNLWFEPKLNLFHEGYTNMMEVLGFHRLQTNVANLPTDELNKHYFKKKNSIYFCNYKSPNYGHPIPVYLVFKDWMLLDICTNRTMRSRWILNYPDHKGILICRKGLTMDDRKIQKTGYYEKFKNIDETNSQVVHSDFIYPKKRKED